MNRSAAPAPSRTRASATESPSTGFDAATVRTSRTATVSPAAQPSATAGQVRSAPAPEAKASAVAPRCRASSPGAGGAADSRSVTCPLSGAQASRSTAYVVPSSVHCASDKPAASTLPSTPSSASATVRVADHTVTRSGASSSVTRTSARPASAETV